MIHDIAPFGCAMVDAHMTHEYADQLSLRALQEIHEDFQQLGPYAKVWARLAYYEHNANPPEENRRQMRAYMEANGITGD
jgi:hypothetical protein